MRMLFVHGAGGYEEDCSLADALGAALDASVDLPRLPNDDMSYEAWAAPVRERLAALDAGDLVIGHSFGATVLLRILGEQRIALSAAAAVLLAMPSWGPEGWDVAAYGYDGPEPDIALHLHHCRDDEVVPFSHLALNAAMLPSARVHEHPRGGHQMTGLAEVIAASVRA